MSVRVRTTIAATVAVGVALLVAGVALLMVQRRGLVADLDEVADLRAAGVAALDADGDLTLADDDDDEVVRVVDAEGVVKAETPGFEDELTAGFVPRDDDAEVRTIDDWRVTALRSDDGDIVYVAMSLEPVDESVAVLRGSLLAGGPLLVILVALTTWFVTGRALRPVDEISRQVGEISAHSLDRRVPVPDANDEINRLARTMNIMLDRLQASAEQQQRFVADASHELRTPLAALRADLESSPPSDQRDDLLATTVRMERLVQDLLYLARSDRPRPLPSAPIDLEDVVLDEVRRSRGAVDTTHVSAAAVLGHRDDLGRVVRNLLDNALRHASSRVEVSLATVNGSAVLTVADDGPGVPPADRERIFERFTRLDDARTRATGGAGLGLAIAREIVVAHGGTIGIDGGRFVVTLPAS